MLKTLSAQQKTNWKDHLPKLAFAYNSTVCKSTGFSPFELIFGRSSRLPVDFMFNTDDINPNRLSYQEFVRKWKESLEKACEIARKSSQNQKSTYDKRTKGVELKIGYRVLVRNLSERGGTGK